MPGKRARRHFSQLSEFERGLIIGMKTAGWSTRRVARQVDRSECAVGNCWEQWIREGTHARKTGSGAKRKATRREDRRILRQALVDPTVTRSTIRANVGVAIVPQTISRHLAEANFKSKRPFRALPLTPEHLQLRLQWCQARSMWNVTDWQKVVFSDESQFVLGTDDNRVRVWRRPAYDSWFTLIVTRGTLTGQHYVDDILRPYVGSFLNSLSGAMFQQDNAHPHTARVAQDFLRHIQTLPWSTRFPYLSPVEHVWGQLKRQMQSCHSVHDLELAVQDLWAHLPQDNIRCLINSMPDVRRHVLQVEVVQRAIEVAQYLCRCTPCIRLIVLFLRSSESLICVIMFIKFHFNPMLSSWVAIFNVPEFPKFGINREIWKWDSKLVIKLGNGSEISRQIWNWEIVNPDDPGQGNGTKILNYSIAIGP
ncbi:transposable element Tc3 transposase [Trichonephila clavipes]|nr:transposable element Tc3 transposase [Trichonephila clavipes]